MSQHDYDRDDAERIVEILLDYLADVTGHRAIMTSDERERFEFHATGLLHDVLRSARLASKQSDEQSDD